MLAHLEDEVAQRIHHDTSSLFHNRHSRVQLDLCDEHAQVHRSGDRDVRTV